MKSKFALGVDYGTNSVRAVIVNLENGSEVAAAINDYPSGEAGILLDSKRPLLARQNPKDYIDGFYQAVSKVIKKSGIDPNCVVGMPSVSKGTKLVSIP